VHLSLYPIPNLHQITTRESSDVIIEDLYPIPNLHQITTKLHKGIGNSFLISYSKFTSNHNDKIVLS